MVKGPETTSDFCHKHTLDDAHDAQIWTIPNVAKQKASLLFEAVRFCLG